MVDGPWFGAGSFGLLVCFLQVLRHALFVGPALGLAWGGFNLCCFSVLWYLLEPFVKEAFVFLLRHSNSVWICVCFSWFLVKAGFSCAFL